MRETIIECDRCKKIHGTEDEDEDIIQVSEEELTIFEHDSIDFEICNKCKHFIGSEIIDLINNKLKDIFLIINAIY